jgi:hypothetical protein
MLRIIAFIVAAAALLLVLWWLTWSLIHILVVGFWIAVVALIGFGLFRVTRRSRRARD